MQPLLTPRRFAAGQLIIGPEPGHERIYVTRSGTVRLLQRHANGREVMLERLERGHLFGVTGLLSSSQTFTPEQRKTLQSWMDEIYGVFKGHVTAIRGPKRPSHHLQADMSPAAFVRDRKAISGEPDFPAADQATMDLLLGIKR